MTTYTKIIDNKVVYAKANNIIVYKNGKQIINPSLELIVEDGWEEYNEKNCVFSEEDTLEDVIDSVIQDVISYDKSDNINICYISFKGNVIPYWADKLERSSLKIAVQDSVQQGRTHYRLDIRELGVAVNMECDKLLDILSKLEVYAIDCYNKTTDHIFAIKELTSIEDVNSYDYKCGYPDKLVFEI